MYSKLAFFIVSAFTLGALAAPGGDPAPDAAGGPPPPPPPPPTTIHKCNSGKLNCCKSVQDAKSDPVQNLAGLLGIPVGSLTGQVGLTCNPILNDGLSSGANCASQVACCKGNSFQGLITLACTPINANL